IVSKASDDLPEPESPVMTTSASRGIATVTSLRLCSRAPVTTIWDCRDTRSSVRKPRTEKPNRCSLRLALCGPVRIGSGFSSVEGAAMVRWAPWEIGVAPPATTGANVLARLRVAPPRRAVLIGLWATAAVAELLALRPVLFDREAPIQGLDVVFTLVGGSFAAFGLVAWRRRPDSRSGPLMTATGFAFFVNPLLGQLDAALPSTVRVLFVDVWVFFFVALILTLLTGGRLQSRLDRPLVASFALPLGIGQLAWMMFEPEEGHLLLALPDADVAHAIDKGQRATLVVLCVATVVVIVARWWTSSGRRRRALLPSLAGAFGLLCFAALLINDLVAGTRSQTLLWIAACSLVSVPAAFLAGLLRSRLARGGLTDLFRGLGTMAGDELQRA